LALTHAARLLDNDPALAAEQATEILKVVPGHPLASLYLGAAWRCAGRTSSALEFLEALCRAQPHWAPVHFELGMTLSSMGRGDEAIAAFRRTTEIDPDHVDAWRALGDHLVTIGDSAGADAAYARHLKASTRDPRLLEAAAALCDNHIGPAEALLRAHLKQHPTDIAAIRMLAEVAARLGRYGDSEKLLSRCLELAPGFTAARYNYAIVLHRQNKSLPALAEVDRILTADPRNPGYRNLRAAILIRIGEFTQAIATYEAVLGEYPQQPKVWMSLGHALKSAGRQNDCIEAYRRSIELAPELGEVYWSLANLKTFRFTPAEIQAMHAGLERSDLSPEDRWHFHFALGKALEDTGDYAESFAHYAEGNRQRRALVPYRADEATTQANRSIALFSREFFAQRAGSGSQAPDPIFIVGLPRSGSTLLEQILSSHSAVEGTMELPDIPAIVRALGERRTSDQVSKYPEVLEGLSVGQLRELGEQYLAATRIQRKAGRPFFIDKLPNNFAHVGLIHLILPNARIIDARRHPLACCLSNFRQHFARGQSFTYDLDDLGRYYRDYVRLMAHYDEVLPGRIHRVFYERMVEDTEGEIRRLLDYCGLPFEPACLRFYETDRAVRTASSEQVRQPIYREGVDQFRHYEPWLGPLVTALGDILEQYPSVPPGLCRSSR
jgi:predicted Zn-dependent protease